MLQRSYAKGRLVSSAPLTLATTTGHSRLPTDHLPGAILADRPHLDNLTLGKAPSLIK
jgi:hypothetical protein